MDKEKLKESLHKYIDEMEDEAALQQLHAATVVFGLFELDDNVDDLTPEQLKLLDISIKQADEGKTIPHEEVMRQIRERIKGRSN